MEHMEGRAEGARAQKRDGTFTGDVWGDPLMPSQDGVTMNTVYFSPGGRTHWHRHEGGQVMHISSGEGWVASRKEAVQVRKGDTVWAPPGEEHWHGAAEDAFMVHVAVSLGATEWLGPVTEQEFNSAGSERPSAEAGKADQ
jgi:quercetin dioxygenase-like cupin family protein